LSYTPSTLVAFSSRSAPISIARRAAPESVVKNGLPTAALFQVADGAAADVILADVVDLDRAHHAGLGAQLFQGVLHGQRVDHGGEHAHLVAGDPVHAACGQAGAAEDVAAADHQGHFGAGRLGFHHLTGEAVDHLGVDAVVLVSHQRLPGNFQQDAAIGEL